MCVRPLSSSGMRANPLASSLRHGRAGSGRGHRRRSPADAFRDPFAVSVLDGLAQVLDAIPTGMLLIAQRQDDPDGIITQLSGYALDALVFSLCGPAHTPSSTPRGARHPHGGQRRPDDDRVAQLPSTSATPAPPPPTPPRPRPPPRRSHRHALPAGSARPHPSPRTPSATRPTTTRVTAPWASSTSSDRTRPWSRRRSRHVEQGLAGLLLLDRPAARSGPQRSSPSPTSWPSGPSAPPRSWAFGCPRTSASPLRRDRAALVRRHAHHGPPAR